MANARAVQHYSKQSLMPPLIYYGKGDVKGQVYVIGDGVYIRMDFDGHCFAVPNTQGEPFRKPRIDFVEDCLNDSHCVGFVPVSEDIAREIRERLKLSPIFQGVFLPDIGQSFVLYHNRRPFLQPKK